MSPVYIAVPFEYNGDDSGSVMEIGYIIKKDMSLRRVGEMYIAEIKKYLKLG